MSLYFASINSGSNGNCYYVGTPTDAVLIDAGLSCKETERRMRSIGLSMNIVKAIFISHEHTDHIKGVASIARKYGLPVYLNPLTSRYCERFIPLQYTQAMQPGDTIHIGKLSVTAFSKMHDAADPVSFVVANETTKVGVFTDIGICCERVIQHFTQCNAVFLEANYDEEMLANGHYPIHLKNRIRSDKGHLSNKQALDLFLQYRPAHMSHLVLSHLSKENNSPQLVEDLFLRAGTAVKIVVASRYQTSDLFCTTATANSGAPFTKKKAAPVLQMQLELFS